MTSMIEKFILVSGQYECNAVGVLLVSFRPKKLVILVEEEIFPSNMFGP